MHHCQLEFLSLEEEVDRVEEALQVLQRMQCTAGTEVVLQMEMVVAVVVLSVRVMLRALKVPN